MSSNPLLAIQSQYWAVRDYLSPVLKESKFKEHGRITPEEFVAAGDFLVARFGMWQWAKSENGRNRDFLPADKQYLITRSDIVNEEDDERLVSLLDGAEEAPGVDGKTGIGSNEDEWVETHVNRKTHDIHDAGDIPDMDEGAAASGSHTVPDMSSLSIDQPTEDAIPDLDDIPDVDDEGMAEGEEDDAAVALPPKTKPNDSNSHASQAKVLQVRTYDCFISYDKHYQTPRFWLSGYGENKTPLSPEQTFEDVVPDYRQKTMTMEVFPHTGQLLASVHPCKHASVMKIFIDRMSASQPTQPPTGMESSSGKKKWGIGGMVRRVTGTGPNSSANQKTDTTEVASTPQSDQSDQEGGMRVEFYLIVFLKFIASIVPTIEVDSTTSF